MIPTSRQNATERVRAGNQFRTAFGRTQTAIRQIDRARRKATAKHLAAGPRLVRPSAPALQAIPLSAVLATRPEVEEIAVELTAQPTTPRSADERFRALLREAGWTYGGR
jgi:hypothetical protein